MICPFCNIFCDDVDECNDVCKIGYTGFSSNFDVEFEKVVRALNSCKNPLFCFSSLDVLKLAEERGFSICKPYATCKLEDLKNRDLICYNYNPVVENPRLLSMFFRIGMNKLVVVGNNETSKIADLKVDSLEEAVENVDKAVVLAKAVLDESYVSDLIDFCKDFGVDLIFTSFIPKEFDFDFVLTSQNVEFDNKLTFGVFGDVKCFDVGRVLRMDGVELEVDANVPSTYEILRNVTPTDFYRIS
ncbi:hypothetical protein [Archaeoglobus sp.]